MTQGEKIKQARIAAEWSVPLLAFKINRHPSVLYKWENGKRNPKFKALKAIAEACKVDVEDLL